MATRFDASDVKTTEFHLNEENKAASVTESQVIVWDTSGEKAVSLMLASLEGKGSPKFTTGKWYPHQNCNQVILHI